MTDKATINLCVLWEEEIRNAARLMKEANIAANAGNDEDGILLGAAWAAAYQALSGADDIEKCLVLLRQEGFLK